MKVKNATENPLTLTFAMSPPPIVTLGETDRNITVAAGGEGVVAFPVPSQAFPQEGACVIPYRMTLGSGGTLNGEAAVVLRTQTRWWVTSRIKTGPKPSGDDGPIEGLDGPGGLAGLFSQAGDVFTLAAPSKGWKPVTCGNALPLGDAGPLPSRDSMAIGATRAVARGDMNAVVDVRVIGVDGKEISIDPPSRGAAPFFIRVWLGDRLAINSRLPAKERAKAVRLLKGASHVVVEWQSNADGEAAAGNVLVRFNDAESGKPLPGVILDMEQR
jgi:hypothetical protein